MRRRSCGAQVRPTAHCSGPMPPSSCASCSCASGSTLSCNRCAPSRLRVQPRVQRSQRVGSAPRRSKAARTVVAPRVAHLSAVVARPQRVRLGDMRSGQGTTRWYRENCTTNSSERSRCCAHSCAAFVAVITHRRGSLYAVRPALPPQQSARPQRLLWGQQQHPPSCSKTAPRLDPERTRVRNLLEAGRVAGQVRRRAARRHGCLWVGAGR